jgi:hypothetical protein
MLESVRRLSFLLHTLLSNQPRINDYCRTKLHPVISTQPQGYGSWAQSMFRVFSPIPAFKPLVTFHIHFYWEYKLYIKAKVYTNTSVEWIQVWNELWKVCIGLLWQAALFSRQAQPWQAFLWRLGNRQGLLAFGVGCYASNVEHKHW